MHTSNNYRPILWTFPCLLALLASTSAPLAAQEPKLRMILGEGHASGVTSLTWSPDGKLLASLDFDTKAGEDGLGALPGLKPLKEPAIGTPSVRLWEVSSSSNYATFADPDRKVAAMRFSPDNQTLTLASLDGTIRSLDTTTGKVKLVGKLPIANATHLAVSPDAKVLAARGEDNVVRLWDIMAAKEKSSFEVGFSKVSHLTFSPDGAVVAVAAPFVSKRQPPQGVVMHDAATGKKRFGVHGVGPALAFSGDGKSWATVPHVGEAQLRDMETGKLIRWLGGSPQPRINALTMTPDGKTLAAGDPDPLKASYTSNIAIINTTTGEQHALRTFADGGGCIVAAFSPDGKSLAARYTSKDIVIWGVRSASQTASLGAWPRPIKSLVLSPDAKLVAAWSPAGFSPNVPAVVRLLDLSTKKQLAMLERCSQPTFSPDGTLLAMKEPGAVKLWKVADNKLHETLKGDAACFAFSPDSKTLAIGLFRERAIMLWDAASGKKSATLTGHTGPLRSLAFRPDGKLLASAASDDRPIRLWDLATAKSSATLEGQKVFSLHIEFSPDGKLLASMDGNYLVHLWDVAAGKMIATLPRKGSPPTFVFSPDSKLIALTGDSKHHIHLYDTATGKLAGTLLGHGRKVDRPFFTPDGKWLISAGEDLTVRLWDVAARKEFALIKGDISAALSQDGSTLATGGVTIRIWDLPPRVKKAP